MAYPTIFLQNQFGEKSLNQVIGGSGQLSCNFIVDSTNGNGLGIRSLKGPGISAVYMHTSSTPAAGNPNPAAGYILIQFANGYQGYNGGGYGFIPPVSGTPINVTTGVTLGLSYVIVSVGTTTPAQWQLLGLPANITPAVGVAFVAKATTTATGTGVIEVPATAGSGVDHLEAIGDANLMVQPLSGGSLILAAMFEGALTAPANGTVIGLSFNMLEQFGQPEN